MNFSFNN